MSSLQDEIKEMLNLMCNGKQIGACKTCTFSDCIPEIYAETLASEGYGNKKKAIMSLFFALESDLAYYSKSDTFTKDFIFERINANLKELGYES